MGSKYDVSSNDMLMWWEQDDTTRLAVLYIELFGNPRKFARTARRVSRTMPVLALAAGRSAAGHQAAASHTGAVAIPLISREALFEQAGLIPAESLGELLDTAALLASQPIPAGRTSRSCPTLGARRYWPPMPAPGTASSFTNSARKPGGGCTARCRPVVRSADR